MEKILVIFPHKLKGKIHPWLKNQIEALREAGCRIEIVKLPERRGLFLGIPFLIFKVISLVFLIPQNQVVYVPATYLLSLTTLLAKIFRKKVIISHHLTTASESERVNLPVFLKKSLNYLDKIAYSLSDLVITHSISTKEGIIREFGINEKKVKAFYSCLDLKFFSPDPKYQKFAVRLKKKLGIENKDIVFYHGFFYPWHGLRYFFKIVPDLLKVNPNFAFVILGADKKTASKFFPQKIVKNPNFYFLPPVPYKRLPYYLASADLWFGRFAKEKSSIPAFTTAGIEAMACGKPIIVSPSREYKRFIRDGVNGIIVPFNNSKAIFEKISFYFKVENKDKLKKMGSEARKTAEKYFSRKVLVGFFREWLEEGEKTTMVKSVWGKRIKNMTNYSKANLKEKRIDKRLSGFIKKGDRVLDVGCFYPTEAMRFAQKGCQVVAIDLSPQVILKAKKVAVEKGLKNKIKFEVGDATNLKYKNNSFDVVCDFATSVHIPCWQRAIREYARVLKKEGKLVIVTDNKLQPVAWVELIRQYLHKGVHPRWGYVGPLFPWQLKKKLERNGLKVEKFDSEGLWKPVLPRAGDRFLEKILERLAKKASFVKYIGWRYGFVAIKK